MGPLSFICPALVARDRDDDYSNRNFNLTDTHTFSPTLINELRAGILRNHFPFRPAARVATGHRTSAFLRMFPMSRCQLW
jgi:hypothetical protein